MLYCFVSLSFSTQHSYYIEYILFLSNSHQLNIINRHVKQNVQLLRESYVKNNTH